MFSLFDALKGLRTLEIIALLIIIVAIVSLYIRERFTIRYPSNLPRIIDKGSSRFSLRTRLLYYTNCEKLFQKTYEEYSRHGRSCLIPGMGFRDEVIIPNNSLKWLSSQPSHVLSIYDAFMEIQHGYYNTGKEIYIKDPWNGQLIGQMNCMLERLAIEMNEEVSIAFDRYLGIDPEWKEINVLDTMRNVVARVSSRFTVGLPLCRNEKYLRLCIDFTDQFFLVIALMGLMPKFLRPVLGRVIMLLRLRNLRAIEKEFKPVFESRMQQFFYMQKSNLSEPRDHLDVMICFAQTDRPNELNLRDMTARIATSNLAAFHQTSAMVTNAVFNIVASNSEFDTISILRDEIARLTKGKTWTKALLAKMVHADSLCRETLRLHSFGNRSVMRQVMVDNLKTEDGIVLPRGAMLSVLARPVQVNGEVYLDPYKFDPFRFSRPRMESIEVGNQDSKSEAEANRSFVSLGPNFLPFSYGRHACPGRFLVDFEFKMLITYLLTHYDVELPQSYNGLRPETKWLAEAAMPPPEGRLRIRRKAQDTTRSCL